MPLVAENTDSLVSLELSVNGASGGVTGLTVMVAIRDADTSAGSAAWLDFVGLAFKTVGWTTRQVAATEVSAANAPGQYTLTVDPTLWTVLTGDEVIVEWDVSGSVTANAFDRVQFVNHFKDVAVAGDAMDLVTDAVDANAVATSGANEVRDAILSDSTPFPGASVTEVRLAELDAANLPTDIANVQSDTDDIQTRLPAALVGGRMDSDVGGIQSGAITAASIATDAIGSAELATSAVNEIRDSILSDSTPFPGASITEARLSELDAANIPTDLANIEADTQAIETDTQNIQSRLPAALVGGAMDSDVSNIQSNVIDAASIAANAIGASEIAANAIGASELATDAVNEIRDAILADSTPFNGADVPAILADTVNIQSRLPAALVGGKMDSSVSAIASGAITAATFAANAVNANALATDAVNEIVNAVFAFVIETGFSFDRVVRIMTAAVATNSSGGPGNFTARNLLNTANQIVASATPAGDRTIASYGV